jgi:hypothetical protein
MKWPESQTDFEVIGHASVKVFKLTRQNEGCIVDKFRRPVHLSISFQVDEKTINREDD